MARRWRRGSITKFGACAHRPFSPGRLVLVLRWKRTDNRAGFRDQQIPADRRRSARQDSGRVEIGRAMADAGWFFADGDVERGPITESQLRTLIATGNLKPEHQVWKEGMDDWAFARDVAGLFDRESAPAPTAGAGPAAGVDPRSKSPRPAKAVADAATSAVSPRSPVLRFDVKRPWELFRYAAFLGQPLLLVGLVVILLTRGCDRLGQRHVARAQALARQAESEFQDGWDRQKQPIEQELDELREQNAPSPEHSGRRSLLEGQLRTLNEAKQAELERLRSGKWRQLNTAAHDAQVNQVLSSFWREGIFWVGACLFSLALLIVGFSSPGPERWMAWAMLGAIVLSLFLPQSQ